MGNGSLLNVSVILGAIVAIALMAYAQNVRYGRDLEREREAKRKAEAARHTP